MSIVPSAGQMGPGTGMIALRSVGAVLMKHPTLFKGLGMGPAITGISGLVYLGDRQRAKAVGFGDDIQAYRNALADQLTVKWTTFVSLQLMSLSSERGLTSTPPGGGGPGDSPISTVAPPSIEEIGEILSNPSIVGEVPSSPRRSTSKKAGKRRKSCPPGYRWNGRRCVKKG